MMITRSNQRFESPYHRIMFGLGLCDLLQSLAIMAGPFASPKGTLLAVWAIGNVHSCNAVGFFIFYGNICCPLYLFFLCCHLYYRTTRRMANADFFKIEWKVHCTIHAFASITCIWALVSNDFNSLRGGICYIAKSPPECELDNEYSQLVGECTRGFTAANFFWVSVLTSLFCMFSAMVILITLLIKQQRMFHNNEIVTSSNHTINIAQAGSDDTGVPTGTNADLIRIWRREAIIQAILLCSILTFTYLPPALFQLEKYTGVEVPTPVKITFSAIFYPLKGVFNIFIYVGPKLTRFRLENPEYSGIMSFCLIVQAGGNIPTSNDEYGYTLNCKLKHFCFCCICLEQDHHDGISDLSSRPSARQLSSVDITSTGVLSTSGRITSFLSSLFVTKKSFNGEPRQELKSIFQDEKEEEIRYDALGNADNHRPMLPWQGN